jgi:hypothetical protein
VFQYSSSAGGDMTQARTQGSESAVRTIDAGVLPERFARGWHCLGLLDTFRDGKPHAIEAFGTKLVVFGGGPDGTLSVLDAYCRHMGGDLTQGTVKDGNIAGPHRVVDHARQQRDDLRLERPRGQSAGAGV